MAGVECFADPGPTFLRRIPFGVYVGSSGFVPNSKTGIRPVGKMRCAMVITALRGGQRTGLSLYLAIQLLSGEFLAWLASIGIRVHDSKPFCPQIVTLRGGKALDAGRGATRGAWPRQSFELGSLDAVDLEGFSYLKSAHEGRMKVTVVILMQILGFNERCRIGLSGLLSGRPSNTADVGRWDRWRRRVRREPGP